MILVRGVHQGPATRAGAGGPTGPMASSGSPPPGGERGPVTSGSASPSAAGVRAPIDPPAPRPTQPTGPTMLTAKEIAERLNVGESTIRSWRDRYPDFVMKRRSRDGSRVVYALERFLEIQHLHQQPGQRRSTREIRAELARRYPIEANERSKALLRLDDVAAPTAPPPATSLDTSGLSGAIRDVLLDIHHDQRRTLDDLALIVGEALGRDGPLEGYLARVGEGILANREAIESNREVIAGLVASQRHATELADRYAELLEQQARAYEKLATRLEPPPQAPPSEPPRYSLRWFWWRLTGWPSA